MEARQWKREERWDAYLCEGEEEEQKENEEEEATVGFLQQQGPNDQLQREDLGEDEQEHQPWARQGIEKKERKRGRVMGQLKGLAHRHFLVQRKPEEAERQGTEEEQSRQPWRGTWEQEGLRKR